MAQKPVLGATGSTFLGVVVVLEEEVLDRQKQQIGATDNLELPELQQVTGRQYRDQAEDEGPPDAVPKRSLLLGLVRQVTYHHRQHKGIVSAQETLEDHQRADRKQNGW